MRIKLIIRAMVLYFFTSSSLNINAQVKEMINIDEITRKVHNKYKSTQSVNITNNKKIERDDLYGSVEDYECIARAIRYASLLMEMDRIKNGIKLSAETTVKVFGSTLKAFGFGYVADGVKILSLLDDVQKEGGDPEDFAKAIAQYAFDKGSGKLLNEAKAKAPNLFDDQKLSGEGMKMLADLAKSESGSFFKKILNPTKEILFDFRNKSGNCKEHYYGEIISNEDEIIKEHIGPILVIKIGFSCKCIQSKTGELKDGIVRFNIPLDLVKNPKAWSMDDKKSFINKTFRTMPPDYIYTLVEDKTTINVTAECCDRSYENASYADPTNTSDTKEYFEVGLHGGLPLGEEKDFYSLVFGADASYLFNVNDNFSTGPRIGYTHFTGKDVEGFKVDGIGFIPAGGIIKYSFSNKISFEANFGYIFSTEENIDGGINYGVGVGWEIAPGIVIRPEISFINLGDSGSFNSFGVGFLYAFWRK